jgi:hypothetical protein
MATTVALPVRDGKGKQYVTEFMKPRTKGLRSKQAPEKALKRVRGETANAT